MRCYACAVREGLGCTSQASVTRRRTSALDAPWVVALQAIERTGGTVQVDVDAGLERAPAHGPCGGRRPQLSLGLP